MFYQFVAKRVSVVHILLSDIRIADPGFKTFSLGKSSIVTLQVVRDSARVEEEGSKITNRLTGPGKISIASAKRSSKADQVQAFEDIHSNPKFRRARIQPNFGPIFAFGRPICKTKGVKFRL
jgi:hypothetical protein